MFKFKERWLLPSVDSPGAHVRYALHAELSAPGRSFARSAHVALFCAGTHDPALFLANGDAAASNAAVKSKSFALGKVRPFFLLLARSANACLGFGSPRKSRKTKRQTSIYIGLDQGYWSCHPGFTARPLYLR